MRKTIFLAGALVALLASCSKTVVDEPQKEIYFQVADHSVQTKSDPADYKDDYKDVPFGTFAWFKGLNPADNKLLIENQSVSYDEPKNRWAPTGTTYYWPKSGSLDFISYSPYTEDGSNAPAPVITEEGISYPAWDVAAHQDVDVMYSDKATGLTGNINTYNHGYEGVPTLFRHALAKVAFRVKAVYLSRTAEAGDITRWEVDVNSITLNNILSTGKLTLTLGEDGKWAKPEYNVWDPENKTVSISNSPESALSLNGEPQFLGNPTLVLPQVLKNQTVTLNVTIRTYRDLGDGSGEKLVLQETGLNVTAPLYMKEIEAWEINQMIIYDLGFNPAAIGGGDPSDPNYGPSVIDFDPAVVDWDYIDADFTISV